MNNETIQKNYALIEELKGYSGYYLESLPGPEDKKFLCIQNENMLHAVKAVLWRRTNTLYVNGIDQKGELIPSSLPMVIIEDQLVDFVADAVVDIRAIGVKDVGLAKLYDTEAEPYTIECHVIDGIPRIKKVEFIVESYTLDGCKFGITLDDGIEGEIVVKFGDKTKGMMVSVIQEFSIETKTVSTAESRPGFEELIDVELLKVGDFELVLWPRRIVELALVSTVTIGLEDE